MRRCSGLVERIQGLAGCYLTGILRISTSQVLGRIHDFPVWGVRAVRRFGYGIGSGVVSGRSMCNGRRAMRNKAMALMVKLSVFGATRMKLGLFQLGMRYCV